MTNAPITKSNTSAKPVPADQPRAHRAVDLGREEQLVTWAEWFARTSSAMQQMLDPEQRKQLRFRVTLIDGRVFAIRQAMSHVSRGKCSIEPTRWDDLGEACDVITGYQMLGEDAMGNVTMVAVTPDMIMSVECVLPKPRTIQEEKEEEEREPFGFASFMKLRPDQPALTEIEEPIEAGRRPPAPADVRAEGSSEAMKQRSSG